MGRKNEQKHGRDGEHGHPAVRGMRLPEARDIVLARVMRGGELAPASLVTVISVVVDRTVADVEDQLHERMWVGMTCAGTHLHRKQQNENETEDADERG